MMKMTRYLVLGLFLLTTKAQAAAGPGIAPCVAGAPIPLVKPADQTAGPSSPAFSVSLNCSSTETFTVNAFTDAACTIASVSALSNTTKTGSTAGGVVTWANLIYVSAMTEYIKVSAPNFTDSACVGPIVISPGAAVGVDYSTSPSTTGTINTVLAQPPVGKVIDTYNNTVTSDNGTSLSITAFTNNTCTAAATGTVMNATASTSSGLANFTNFKYSKAGQATYFKLSSGALTSACTAASTTLSKTTGPGEIKSCASLSGNYTVNTSTSVRANGGACGSVKFKLIDNLNGIDVPMCVEADCGANAAICTQSGDSGNSMKHYCYYCSQSACLN